MAKRLRPDTGDNRSLPCAQCGTRTPDASYQDGLPVCDNCAETVTATGMDDLVTWLRAAWDAREREVGEDERVVTAAYPNTWSVEATRHENEFLIVPDHFPSSAGVARGEANAAHIARWDPARVLREVADERADIDAERRILNLHRPVVADDVPGLVQCGFCHGEAMPCQHVRLLALSMAGRDGYRSEWAP